METDPISGLKKVVLIAGDSSAEVYLHGGHVTSWKLAGREVLFLSKHAVLKPPKAIRGGIPVCFPQFGTLGSLSQHGFARNATFSVAASPSASSVTLSLEPSKNHLRDFPHSFRLSITVTLEEGSLTETLTAENTGEAAFEFTAALHTYYSVSDIAKVQIKGVQGLTYWDSTNNFAKVKEEAAALSFLEEVDRIYVAAPEKLEVVDKGWGQSIIVEKRGFPDAVVWNPWAEKAAGMSDFGDDEYKGMVCLEPALAASGPVKLGKGQTWSGTQTLHVAKL